MSKTTENYGFTKPEVGEFFSLETWNGNMDKIDKELKKREDAQKESDNSLMNPEFTEAKERKNLTSGEKIHLMLGKISKFFSDMKAIAFSGSYNDLVDKPKIPTVLNNQTTTVEGYALDARQANPNIDGTLAKQVADLSGSLNGSNKVSLFTISDCIDINCANVFRISNKLYLVQGYIHLKETAKQNELLIKTGQLYEGSSLILTSNVSGMSFPVIYNGTLVGLVSPNRDIPGDQYYYISGFLMEF